MVAGRHGQEGASVLTASGDGRPRSGFVRSDASVLTASEGGRSRSDCLLDGASVLTASDGGRPRSGSLRSLLAVPSEERATDVSAGGPAQRPVASRELGRSAHPTKPSGAAMVTSRYGQESTEIGENRIFIDAVDASHFNGTTDFFIDTSNCICSCRTLHI